MKCKIFFIHLIFTLITFSCKQTEHSPDLLKLEFDINSPVQVIRSETGEMLLRGLEASFSDGQGKVTGIFDFTSASSRSEFSDSMGKGTETTFVADTHTDSLHLKWSLRTFRNKPVLAVRFEIENRGTKEKRIERLDPVNTGAETGGILLTGNDSLSYIEIEPETWAAKQIKRLKRKGTGKFVTGISNASGEGVVIGCLTFENFRGVFEMVDNRESAGTLEINAFHHIDDHLMLQPGDSLGSEWIYVNAVSDVFTGLEDWAGMAGRVSHAVVSDPPAAGFYTWYYYRDYVSEKIMLENTDFLARNRDRFPVNYIHIDWGWQRRYSSGDTAVNEKFPHGLNWLAGRIRKAGFIPSIWVNPFMYTHPTAEAVIRKPGVFLRNSDGKLVEHEPIRNIMANVWGDAAYMISDGVTNVLDVSNPETWDFLRDRYAWVRSNGFGMAMMDFIIYGRSSYEAGHRLYDPDVSIIEGIRKSLSASRQGLGEGGNVLGCGTIYEASVGTSNLTRISYDATANWASVKVASGDLLLQYFMNNRLWTNYADGIFVRDKISPYWGEFEVDDEGNRHRMFLSDDEAQFYTAVTGMTQSAVMYTEDIQRLKPERQWLISMLLPIYDRGKFRPVDLFKSIPAKTLKLECSEGNRTWIIAGGLNWSDSPDEDGLDISLLDLQENMEYHAFDIFGKVYLGKVNSRSRLDPVPAHGVLLVNLVPMAHRPQMIGTDLHISQGAVEISGEIWNKEKKVLTLSLNELNGRKGNIYLRIPSGYVLSEEKNSVKPISLKDGVLRIPVVLDGLKNIDIYFD